MSFQIENRLGTPFVAGDTQVFPITRMVRWTPMGRATGGLSWSSPSQVLVKRPNGEEVFLPVQDVTRQAVLFLGAVGILASLALLIAFRRKKINEE